MTAQPWLNASYLTLMVENGAVQLWGFVASNAQRGALKVLVEETDGVIGLDDHLAVGLPSMMQM